MYQKFAKNNAYGRYVFLLFAKSRAEPPYNIASTFHYAN